MQEDAVMEKLNQALGKYPLVEYEANGERWKQLYFCLNEDGSVSSAHFSFKNGILTSFDMAYTSEYGDYTEPFVKAACQYREGKIAESTMLYIEYWYYDCMDHDWDYQDEYGNRNEYPTDSLAMIDMGGENPILINCCEPYDPKINYIQDGEVKALHLKDTNTAHDYGTYYFDKEQQVITISDVEMFGFAPNGWLEVDAVKVVAFDENKNPYLQHDVYWDYSAGTWMDGENAISAESANELINMYGQTGGNIDLYSAKEFASAPVISLN